MSRMPIGVTILLLIAACGDSSGVNGGRYYRSFSATRQDSVATERVSPDPDFRQIILSGVFEAPTRCQDLLARIDDANRNLSVTVTATARAGICPQTVPGYYRYTMITGPYFPGAYHLTVAHTDSVSTRTVYDGNLVVTQ